MEVAPVVRVAIPQIGENNTHTFVILTLYISEVSFQVLRQSKDEYFGTASS